MRGLVGAVELRDPADGVILAAREHDGRPGGRPAGLDDRDRGQSRADLSGL